MSGERARRWARVASPGLVAAAALVGIGVRPPPGQLAPAGRAAPGPGSAAARGLLGGLGVGDRVAGFEVEGIAGTPADGVHVHLRRGEVRLVVSIVPRGAEPHAPPSQSAHYDLFFGHVRPERPDLEGHEVGAALGELSARVIANEGAGPPALQSFSSAAP